MAVIARAFPAVSRPAADRDGAAPEPRTPLIGQMIETLVRARPRTAAHALLILRHAYAAYPLALRLAALAATMKDITQ
jgi:hypothetical protein